MSSKKRKLSPSLSSRSSATPVPAPIPSSNAIPASASSPPPDNLPPLSLINGSGLGHHDSDAGPSRAGSVSTEATPAPVSRLRTERTEMRMPTMVAGSGDGQEFGQECFAWTDIPTQNGQSTRAARMMKRLDADAR